jgi:glycosyltransferase involved in cell wall biosynthesis
MEQYNFDQTEKLDVLVIVYNQEFLCSRIIANIESYITDEICVHIQDDCSTDQTFQILSRHFHNNKNVNVYSTKKNMGPNGNLMTLIERATAEYMIMLGGDDFINQREIHNILKIIWKDKFDMNVFNCAHADLETVDHLIFGGKKTSERLKLDIRNNNFERTTELNTKAFFEEIATIPGSLWLQGVILKTELMKKISKFESNDVDDWGIMHNLAVYNIDQKLTVKLYDNFITTLTHLPNSRGSDVEIQLKRQLSAVVNNWHPTFKKNAFYNIISKKLKQFNSSNVEIDEAITIMNRVFFELRKKMIINNNK